MTRRSEPYVDERGEERYDEECLRPDGTVVVVSFKTAAEMDRLLDRLALPQVDG